MRKVTTTLVCFLFVINIGIGNAMAQVTEFEPFPMLTLHQGEEYVGVLLSESDFTEIIELKLNHTFLKKVNEILERELEIKNKNLEDTMALFNDVTSKIKTEVRKQSWFEKNKGMIGVVTGFVIGAGLTVLAARAVQ